MICILQGFLLMPFFVCFQRLSEIPPQKIPSSNTKRPKKNAVRAVTGSYAWQYEVHWTLVPPTALIRQGYWKRDLYLGSCWGSFYCTSFTHSIFLASAFWRSETTNEKSTRIVKRERERESQMDTSKLRHYDIHLVE